jgi:cobalamin synthase
MRAIMLALNLAPVAIAGAALAAHFYRAGQEAGVVASLALIALALVRRPWAARVVQAGLLLGALEWLRTMATFTAVRIAVGQPYLRMALILAAIALVTALAALVFERRAMRRRYGLGGDTLPPATRPGLQG